MTTKELMEIASEMDIDMDYFTDWASQYCEDNDVKWLDE